MNPALPATKRMAVAAGVTAIVASGLHLVVGLFGILGMSLSDEPPDTGAVIATAVLIAISIAVIACGVFAIRGLWWASLTTAIVHTILAFTFLLGVIGVRHPPRAEMGGDDRAAPLGAVGVLLIGLAVLSIATAICGYAGIGSARRWQRRLTPAAVADAFS